MRPFANAPANRLCAGLYRLAGVAAMLWVAGCGSGGRVDPSSDPRVLADWQDELTVVQERRSADPAHPYWPFRTAQIYVALDSLDLAQQQLQDALVLEPTHAPALLLLSKIHYQQKRHEEAINLLETALARGSQNPDELRIALALNLEAVGALEEAEAVLAQCADDPALRPGAEAFLSLRSDAFLEARPVTESALASNPASASNHNNHGISLLYDGDPEGARASFMEALALDPELAGALYNLAIVEAYYFYDLDKGREWFSRYAELESDDPDDLQSVFGVDLAAGGHRSGLPWIEPASGEGRRNEP